MKASFAKVVTLVFVLLFLSGCGGWKRGYFSMPYVGDASEKWEYAGKPYTQRKLQKVELPGLQVSVNLQNDMQTSDTVWAGIALPMVPLHLDLENRWRWPPPKKGFFIKLYFIPRIDGLVFKPRQVKLLVDGKVLKAGRLKRWTEKKQMEPFAAETVKFAKEKRFFCELFFDGERPLPDEEIKLDLKQAIIHPQKTPIPIIEFELRKWASPYS